MTVRPEVQKHFNDELQQVFRGTVWGSGCRNYFTNAAGRIVTQWPKASRFYRWATRKVRARDFSFTT
jgi:hypothetical protein